MYLNINNNSTKIKNISFSKIKHPRTVTEEKALNKSLYQ